MGDWVFVSADWRDERIAELEAELSARDVRIGELESQVAALTKQVAELLEVIGRNSRNSHLPPSTDPPGTRGGQGTGKGKPGQRKRGGQPGHGGSHRVLLPPEQVDEVVDFYPSHCEGCAGVLPKVPDSSPKRFQQTEMPPVRPHTKEWRCHEVGCPSCGHRTRAPYDATQIPASAFGPRLMALIALVTGVYHLSRRKTTDLLWELCGVRLSLGALSMIEARVGDALEPAVAEAWKRVGDGAVKHTDGTSWVQAGAVRALWTIATKAATVFKIPRRQQQEDAGAALRLSTRHPRERSRQGAQLLGDGAASDLLGTSAEEVRLVLRARRTGRRYRP
jgi:transposase